MNKLNVVLVAVILASGCSVGIPAPTPEPTVSRQVRAEDAGRFIDAGQNDSGVTVDAGVDCAVGTESCSCTEWGGCAPGLECGVEDICNHSPEDRDAGIEVPDVVSPEPSPEEDAGWVVVDGGPGEVDCTFANPCYPDAGIEDAGVEPEPEMLIRCGAEDCAARYSPRRSPEQDTENWAIAVPRCYLEQQNRYDQWGWDGVYTEVESEIYTSCYDDGNCYRNSRWNLDVFLVVKRLIPVDADNNTAEWGNTCAPAGGVYPYYSSHCLEDGRCFAEDKYIPDGADTYVYSDDTFTVTFPECQAESFTNPGPVVWPYDCAN